jgi:hypothetical protein
VPEKEHGSPTTKNSKRCLFALVLVLDLDCFLCAVVLVAALVLGCDSLMHIPVHPCTHVHMNPHVICCLELFSACDLENILSEIPTPGFHVLCTLPISKAESSTASTRVAVFKLGMRSASAQMSFLVPKELTDTDDMVFSSLVFSWFVVTSCVAVMYAGRLRW